SGTIAKPAMEELERALSRYKARRDLHFWLNQHVELVARSRAAIGLSRAAIARSEAFLDETPRHHLEAGKRVRESGLKGIRRGPPAWLHLECVRKAPMAVSRCRSAWPMVRRA